MRLFTCSIRAGRLIFLTFIGFFIAMSISFALVRAHGGNGARESSPDGASIEKAEQLRLLANELIGLGDLYVRKIAKSEKTIGPKTRQWLEHEFQTRLNALRLRLGELAVTYALPEAELRTLENGMAHLRAMAGKPDSPAVRRTGLRAVLECAKTVEARIDAWGADKYVHTPPCRPRFREDS